MKSQLTKLRGLALNKHGTKEESLPRDADEYASSDVEAYAQVLFLLLLLLLPPKQITNSCCCVHFLISSSRFIGARRKRVLS
jgi:hypothetical protein